MGLSREQRFQKGVRSGGGVTGTSGEVQAEKSKLQVGMIGKKDETGGN